MTDPISPPPSSDAAYILLVDDDFNITSGLKDILEDSGYLVEVASTGAEALDHMTRQAFHVMVVDYSLPDSNGIQLTRRARTLHPTIEVLLMTGHDRLEIEGLNDTRGLYAAFLRKPVDVQQMTSAVEEAMTRQFARLGKVWPPPARHQPAPKPAPSVAYSRTASAVPPSQTALRSVDLVQPVASPRRPWPLIMTSGVALLVGFAGGWFARGQTTVSFHPLLRLARYDTPAATNSLPTPAAPTMDVSSSPVSVIATTAPPVLPSLVAPIQISKPPVIKRPVSLVSHKVVPATPAVVVAAPVVPENSVVHETVSTTTETPPTVAVDAADPLTTLRAALKANPADAQALANLLDLLKDPDFHNRIGAIEVVSADGITTPDIISTLSDMLFDQIPAVAFAAANTLGKTGADGVSAVPQLIEALSYKSEATQSVGTAAKEALERIGEPAVPGLIKGLENLNVCQDVIDVLEDLGPVAKAAIPALTELQNDSEVGAAATQAISQIQGTPTEAPVPAPEKPAP